MERGRPALRSTPVALVNAVLLAASCGDDVDGAPVDEAPPTFSAVHLDLTLRSEDVLEELTYSVQAPGLERSDTTRVADSRQLRFRFGGLPSDDEYTFSLTGTTRAGLRCVALAGFGVAPGSLTQLALERSCNPKARPQPREGVVRVSVRLERQATEIRCPVVSGIGAAPLTTSVGEPIDVEGYTTSPTAVHWSSDAGQFADPSAAHTRFVCRVPGVHMLTFAAALPALCAESKDTIQISCTARDTCGNGEHDAWEECDDGNDSVGDGCTSSCVREPFCVAAFPCARFGTAAFCTGRTQYRRARTAPCAEVCGSSFCSGASCTLTGEPFECPAGQECVMDSRPGSYTARCRRPR